VTVQTLTQRLAGGGGPRRQIAAAAGAIIVVAIVIGIVVGAGAPASSKGQSSGSTASGATTVQRRDLVETDTESGTLGYANAQTVFNRLSGTITYLPNVGHVVKPGGTLYQVDGYPVILFNGSYPAYRDLTSGDTDGPDIEELNADLKARGFDSGDAITVDDVWQAATTDAVERFQESIGQTETGTISLGQIVFLPGPQLVNAVDTTIGSTGGSAGAGTSTTGSGSDSSGDSSGASDSTDPTSTATPASYKDTGQPHAEFVDLTTSSAAAPQSTPASTSAATPPACPGGTATTTTPTTPCPATTTPTTPTTPTTTPAPTTTTPSPTSPMSGTPSSSALGAIVKLLQAQNKLLLAELKSAKAGTGTGTGKGATGATGSGGGGGGGGGGGSASAGSASSGSGSASSSSGAGSSSAGASASAILSTTSTSLVVTVDLDATKQSEAKLHEPVTVELPDGSTVNGKITAVSQVATSTSSGSSSSSPSASAPSATIPVTVSLEKHTDTSGLDQAAVSVNFEEQVANNVLSVPVTALLATQGGGYAVQEAAAPHKLVPVTPGLFAAGYVQISGPDVQDGMQVTDSQG